MTQWDSDSAQRTVPRKLVTSSSLRRSCKLPDTAGRTFFKIETGMGRLRWLQALPQTVGHSGAHLFQKQSRDRAPEMSLELSRVIVE